MEKEVLEAARKCDNYNTCLDCPLRDVESCQASFAKAIVEHHDRYRWHDLRKDHTDLPETEGHFNVCVWLKPNDAWGIEESYIYDTQYFCERFQTTGMSEVIAWKEIDKYESEE